MSIFNFAPIPPRDDEHHAYVKWEDGFTDEELNAIEQYCEDNLTKTTGVVGVEGRTDSQYRNSSVGWIKLNEETNWFYDKLAGIARSLNGQFYRFDLSGFHEDMQYTVYDGSKKAHYDWHIDNGPGDPVTRKFSLVLQLSDPKDYEGGDLELLVGNTPIIAEKQKGLVVAFPSFRLHRVSPVTKGIRKTIVVWVAGPPFK